MRGAARQPTVDVLDIQKVATFVGASGEVGGLQRHLDAGSVSSAHKVYCADNTGRICMMDHVSGPREDIEHAPRHRMVKPLRLRFEADD
jgi:hypothetical protein